MNSTTVRITKEARALFWPWCGVVIAAVSPAFLHHDYAEAMSTLTLFFGIPLLATLALGYEFQHRTLSLRLVQPLPRRRLWSEKMTITAFAVLSAALVLRTGMFQFTWPRAGPTPELLAGMFIVATMASAVFWTLTARSTIGGLFLNICFQSLVFWGVVGAMFRTLDADLAMASIQKTFGPFSLAAFAIIYSGVMLWLGARKLARFELTGQGAGDDLVMAGPSLLPESLARWFRCQPRGAFSNLVRKELRLLRPVWLITFLNLLVLAGLAIFRLLPDHTGSAVRRPNAANAAAGMLIISFALVALLAATIPLGEERTAGTLSWQMTLPVSALRQWLIKLGVAVLAGLFCAIVLPEMVLMAVGAAYRSPFMYLDFQWVTSWVPLVVLIALVSFWCSCAVKGTVPAALSAFPALVALSLAGFSGQWAAPGLVRRIVATFGLFTSFRFTNALANVRLFFGPEANFMMLTLSPVLPDFMLLTALFFLPTLLLALWQSYRLCRKEIEAGGRSLIRSLIPLAATAFLCGLLMAGFFSFLYHARAEMWTMFHETHEAIEKIRPGTPSLDAAHPWQLTGEDLARTSELSERSVRWLRNSKISVAPDKPHPGHYCCWGNSMLLTYPADRENSWYLATIELENGTRCTLSFVGGKGFGVVGGVCK